MKSNSSTTDVVAPRIPEQVLVGIVVRAHGLRGEVVVKVLTDRAEQRFAAGAEIGMVVRGKTRRTLKVRSSAGMRNGLRVRFDGIDDRDAAESLRGARLEVERSEIPPAAAGSYYHFELVGCRSVDAREGELGEVTDVVDGPGGQLLEVTRPGGGKLLLPFVESFLVRVDTAGRMIEWRLPEGLVEACESRF